MRHARFYKRFIKDFSKILKPSCNLLLEDAPFEFNEEYVEAFMTLKKKLTLAIIIVALIWSLLFEIMCNASDYAIEAILGQRKSKQFHVNYDASRILNVAQ